MSSSKAGRVGSGLKQHLDEAEKLDTETNGNFNCNEILIIRNSVT